jgi:hypothetical protein
MDEELKNENIPENKMGMNDQLILLGIIIFLVIVIVLGVIVRTGSFS